ncbi:MAG: ribonuclease HII [bacterium]|nr:ribonuclease HII [bacterium]
MKFMLGVDESGRGPLAGPVAVGIVAVPERFIIVREFPGLADSKQMSPLARAKMFRLLQNRMREGDIQFCVRCTGAERIDNWGLMRAVTSATHRGVNAIAKWGSQTSKCARKSDFHILLDGLLHATPEYNQQTIIGGDEAVPIIALASIAAKVIRDRLMTRLAKQFHEYGFENHKGYGTQEHYDALKKYGPCILHRRSFLH